MSSSVRLALFFILLGVGYAGYEHYNFQLEEMEAFKNEAAQVEAQIAQKQSELKRLQAFAQNIESIKKELQQLNFQFEAALEFMPKTQNLSGLLRKLTILAQSSGIELSSFKPSETEERQPGSFYSTLPIELKLKGSYTSTLLFLDQISRLKRILSTDQVSMDLDPGTAARIQSGALLATTARLRTYRFAE